MIIRCIEGQRLSTGGRSKPDHWCDRNTAFRQPLHQLRREACGVGQQTDGFAAGRESRGFRAAPRVVEQKAVIEPTELPKAVPPHRYELRAFTSGGFAEWINCWPGSRPRRFA